MAKYIAFHVNLCFKNGSHMPNFKLFLQTKWKKLQPTMLDKEIFLER